MPTYQSPVDGATLAYQDYGTGTPIVFVAGWSLNGDSWEYQMHHFLEHGYRCVLPDRRGHGRSDRPRTGYDVNTRADDLAGLIELLDLQDVTLVAHSCGGGEAVRYLSRHGSDRVARLAMLAPTIPFMMQTDDNPVGVPKAALDMTLDLLRTDRPKWFADFVSSYFATHMRPGMSQAMNDEELRRGLSAAPQAVLEVQREAFTTDHRGDIAELTVPTLLIHGQADAQIPIEITSRQLVQLAPDAELKEYWDAGHGLYLTHKDEVNADLHAFIKG
ncbi:alpha/beta hydrolase [Yinghuangia aomiensis]|uniref:Alpha/beta hydrolase n=1 Tax=Yinghuangia aomiensis TaxID=676205 RepID=A0ABP9ICS9_9ACTN